MSVVSDTQKDLAAIAKQVERLMALKEGVWFREPVDWEGMQLLDYPEKVPNPMDLGTVKKNLAEGKYATVLEAAADVRLTFSNCMTYNDAGSAVHSCAESLFRRFEESHSRRFKDDFNATRHPVEEERQKFSKDLFRVDVCEVKEAMNMLRELAPGAVESDTSSEFVVNIDALAPQAFWAVQQYLRSCIQADPSKSKRKITSIGGPGEPKVSKRKAF